MSSLEEHGNNHSWCRPGRLAALRPEKIPWVRRSGKLVLDGALAWLAWKLAVSLDAGPGAPVGSAVFFMGLALAVSQSFRLTAQHYRLVDFKEAKAIVFADLALAVTALVIGSLGGERPLFPGGRALLLSASLLCGMAWFLARLAVGAGLGLYAPETAASAAPERALIVGAGRAGLRLCQELAEHPKLHCQVVGFVDDAPEKQGVCILGVPVLGSTERLGEFISSQRASLVLMGASALPGGLGRDRRAELEALGVKVRTVPGIRELVGDRPWQPACSEVAIEALLRREPVTLDGVAIRRALAGSVALITGAGGSIGSELARRVASFGPEVLVLLGRGENSLWEIHRELVRKHPAIRLEVALCDVRDPTRLGQVFGAHRPRAIFHAAAHKHVPYLEQNPEEAIQNNIFGTRNVLEASLEAGAEIFVNVSTDKAVNPANVLGVSKRIGEQLVTQAAPRAPWASHYVSVRFGNVLGSRGSVIPLFRDQIARGGPLTVTHPDMVRYFMTIPEAVQLVLQAGVLGETSKVFVLDMGAPVRILDLAQDLARLSGLRPGVDIDIAFTGARPGEKLFEEMFSEVEARKADIHAKVFEAVQDRQDPALLEEGLAALAEGLLLPEGIRQQHFLAWFKQLVPTYVPAGDGLGRFLEGAPWEGSATVHS